ncbi:UNVERIFIED_CONTAM: hypothetical protein GTU68_021278, partial [Idotea baltica]|nr:hypothetical protein [Idotea baltica]
YGGSVQNRCRFGLEVLDAIRKAVGDDFLVGLRFIVDEGKKEGLGFEESLEIAEIFQAAGALDFFNAIYGRMDTYATISIDCMPGMASPDAPFLQAAAAFKAAVKLPVMHATKISDVATARHAIREGLIDLVAMTRAHFADPQIVNKIMAGQEATIRPCIGATNCMSPQRPTCLHNPATGHDRTLHQVISKADTARRVAIIGAGPAGLEAARVCGERGHDVTLFEAAPHMGGQVLLAAKASWRKSMIGLVDWRISEIERLGVTVQLNTYADEDTVADANPDFVVVATGGVPNLDWLPGAEHITSPWELIEGSARPADDVLIIDGTGRHVAITAADVCHRAGAQIRFATVDETLAAEQAYAERVIWRKWAREIGLSAMMEESLIGVRKDGNALIATLRSDLTDEETEIRTAQVVFDYGTIPADELFSGLRGKSRNDGVTHLETWVSGKAQVQEDARDGDFELHRIGDAISSRNVNSAITDALRLCQSC